MTDLDRDQLAFVIGGVGGACTPTDPRGLPPPTYIGPSQPPPTESPNLRYADELEHALHGRPPIPR